MRKEAAIENNRVERHCEPMEARLIYLRREHAGATPELVIVDEGQEWYIRLTEDQFRGLTRDATGMFFSRTIRP